VRDPLVAAVAAGALRLSTAGTESPARAVTARSREIPGIRLLVDDGSVVRFDRYVRCWLME
jgi:hypothetical protein